MVACVSNLWGRIIHRLTKLCLGHPSALLQPAPQGHATEPQGENGETDDYVSQIFNLFQEFLSGNSAPICYDEAKNFFQVGWLPRRCIYPK